MVKCNICGKEYRWAGWLRRHKYRLKHLTEDEFVEYERYCWYGKKYIEHITKTMEFLGKTTSPIPDKPIRFFRYNEVMHGR